MLTFFASCFQRVLLSGGILELVERTKSDDSKFICRDELSNKKKSASKQKSYYGDSFSQVPLLKVKDEKDIKRSSSTGFEGKPSSGIRVKVKMTKQEAARLLSKCKDGGILQFRDVAKELANLPMDRVSVVSCCPRSNPLGSIPEEY